MNQIEAESSPVTSGSKNGERTIVAADLLRRLRRAARRRALVSMASALPLMTLGGLAFEGIGAVVGLFGGSLTVSSLMTRFYCLQAVCCPHCGGSLWYCGSGNFKPRRMHLRADARACRQCGAAIR
jgi:hypothetical protein